MRIIITVEDSQPSPTEAPRPPAGNSEAMSAGVALDVAVPADAVPADQELSRSTEQALTDGATSAGPPADPPASAEPIFLPGSVAATEPNTERAEQSTDQSAGPAPTSIT